MLPWSSGSSPSSACIMVVLPVPLVPTMAVTDPIGMEKLPSRQMICPPRRTATSRKTTQGSSGWDCV